MGGDFGPPVMIPAAISALNDDGNLRLILVGNSNQINEELSKIGGQLNHRITIVESTEDIAMDDKPSHALRKKKNSSMALALTAVADGQALACVSAGNTGALMALSRFILKMLPGVDRPAITTAIPTENGHTRLLDLGANVDCSAKQLLQFALMGSAMVTAIDKVSNPSVALLNIGSEDIKGNEQTRATAELLLEAKQLNYIGFIEANSVYAGSADLVVCDGFVGNVFLKASEGVARLVANKLQKEFKRNLMTRLLSVIVVSVLEGFRKRVNPDQYNGASFIGLQGIVIKSHGSANIPAALASIKEAIKEVKNNVPAQIKEQMEQNA